MKQTSGRKEYVTPTLHINEIYHTLQGEGLWAGVPTVFIRTQGCSLRCSYCDTPYGLPFADKATEIGEGKWMTFSDILEAVEDVNNSGTREICLTGGEPLQQKQGTLILLLSELTFKEYHVTIETGGHVPLSSFVSAFKDHSGIHFCVDYKSPSSGMQGKMKEEAFAPLRPNDSIKYVCGSEEDFGAAITHLSWARSQRVHATALFSPVWGSKLGIRGLAENVMKLSQALAPLRLSVQLHKIVWEPSTRAV
jgi:7-carboxy-7-deazaguanine synthase